MRHRATALVRVLTVCVRCGYAPDLYDVRRVNVALRTRSGMRPHELVVCRNCDRIFATEPTWLEQAAMRVDLTQPIEVMEFVQQNGRDPELILRAAEHFLGGVVFEEAMAKQRVVAEAARAESEQFDARLEEMGMRHAVDDSDFDDVRWGDDD